MRPILLYYNTIKVYSYWQFSPHTEVSSMKNLFTAEELENKDLSGLDVSEFETPHPVSDTKEAPFAGYTAAEADNGDDDGDGDGEEGPRYEEGTTFEVRLEGAERALYAISPDGETHQRLTKTVGSSNWLLREEALDRLEVDEDDIENLCFSTEHIDETGVESNGMTAFRMGDLWGFMNSEGEIQIEALYTAVVQDFDEDGLAVVAGRIKRGQDEAPQIRINEDGEIIRAAKNKEEEEE